MPEDKQHTNTPLLWCKPYLSRTLIEFRGLQIAYRTG